MWRTVVAAALIYAYGHPAFEGWRPSGLDGALQAFYVAANDVARDGQRMLMGFESARAKHALKTYYERIDTELRPSGLRAAAARSDD
jgi:hypothetical protein